MTNGISIGDMVVIRANGMIAEVIGIDDHSDRYPADLQLNTGHSHIKARSDEVIKYDEHSHRRLYGKARYPFS